MPALAVLYCPNIYTCLLVYADSEGPDQLAHLADKVSRCPLTQSLDTIECCPANTITGHYRMYQWKANVRMRLRMRRMNLILCFKRMLEDTFSLGAVHFSRDASHI